MDIRFEWDESKNRANVRKHGVPFELARTVFYDPDGRFLPDPDHSETEERFLMLGLASDQRLLLVAHCFCEADSIIRIISARKATKHETSQYVEHL